MLTATIFANGLLFGLILAAPAGPVGVLCIHRTLSEGRLHGLLSGLGAAVADTLFGVIAAFGISTVSVWLLEHEVFLRTTGGIILFALAIRALLTRPRARAQRVRDTVQTESLARDFISTFFLALTNPITLLAFATLMATLGLTEAGASFGNALALVVGVFLGSLMWWLAIAFTAGAFRSFIEGGYQRTIDYVSAAVLSAFAVYALVSAQLLS